VDATNGVGYAQKRHEWIDLLAAIDQDELWQRARELQEAQHRVTELAFGLSPDARRLMKKMEAAHAAVELAERRAESARFPGRGGAAKRELALAIAAEYEVLQLAGFDSWLGFQLRRLDALIDPDTVEDTQAAKADWERAMVAWQGIAPNVGVDDALAARGEIESRASRRVVVFLEPGHSAENAEAQGLPRSDVARA
jgi:hypothetical protein